MFIGQHRSSLDEKNRLTLPARYRGLLTDGVYVTQGFDRNLLLLTSEAFEEILHHIQGMNIADPLARLLFRMILGSAAKLDLDKNGCIPLPRELIKFASIDQEAMVIGQGDYFEVWAPELWSEQEISLNNVEANTHRFAALTLCTGQA
jgi:MraZ protein